ncbi:MULTISPECIES: L,D-transpeptidase [Rhizobium]|jgi:lipoprotein-anchoring transpeptidase ErfK/SrfK|uniref:L, D-transpeptidase catalytic domain family protein n=1 Tax=Rhizobium leguminosarum TaxID=384 RepID=A0A2Z4YJ55_RHILE|nr:L,D-transpeptidase [Rhizobium leguminosarum]AXA41417.1 L, D-transpeptidase catalytic domain family protein [Rhizobium leguminosarum]MBA8836379.1 lipoprotein-anchoring transpeptidase ErfK/SrfK [Rhizobium leguminosarum]MBY5902271.1 L,D-transpeptidase [Rhizobium leguminosarum]MBY5909311.1 L,D-transpeptidase [Rhizobium leguminosarum]MBY5917701.1 L,D-transpeptidase [Rhizobium leguminosarum]
MMKQLVLAAALFGIFSTAALADDRYATRPPVVLSPDLTAPWINQLGGGTVRPVVYQRPVVRQQQRGLFQRRVLRQAPQAAPQTVSAINPGIPSIRHPIEPQYLPQMVDYDTQEKPGTIVIDTNNRFLYLVMQGGKARRYGVGVGKPGFEWAGAHKITRKTEWPDWTPPSEMISREAAKGHYLPARMDGGAENPLGARAMYLGSTLYRIHGTNAPWSIGSAVSSGCIRLRNEDVIDLYDRVSVGTRVIVM